MNLSDLSQAPVEMFSTLLPIFIGDPVQSTDKKAQQLLVALDTEQIERLRSIFINIFEKEPDLRKVAIALAQAPKDERIQTNLQAQIKEVLRRNHDLMGDVIAIENITRGNSQIQQNVQGNQNQVIGQFSGGMNINIGNVESNISI